MKKFISFFILPVLLFFQNKVSAQHLGFNSASQVMPYRLEITEHKTSMLIFPVAIQSADRGERYVLAERVKGVENVLKVKAGKKDFEPSNLQVITVDGRVYTFNLFYSPEPKFLTIDLRKEQPASPVIFEGISLNDKDLAIYAEVVGALKPSFKKARAESFGVELYLKGIYIKNDVLFLSYTLKNFFIIKFDLASLRFYIRDKKKAKRSAIRDFETLPLGTAHFGSSEEQEGQTIVVAFPKFSIAEDKFFVAEVMELNGDRNLVSRFDQSLMWKSIKLR